MFRHQSNRKVRYALALVLGLAGFSTTALAQLRVFGKLIANPTTTTTPLIFDVNNTTDDNVSPNIILSQDQTRGFVAYTGSGSIVEFSLADGSILHRIDTDGYPCFGTVLPGNRIAFVSVFEDRRNFVQGKRIFVVDMGVEPGSSKLVSVYSFQKAAFGFGSILTLSPDQTIGYISSTGTAEVIKFSIADGHEIGRFTGPNSDPTQKLRFPCQVTVSPDGSTLLVVDTDPGTPEVAIFDTLTLAKKGSFKNPDPTKFLVSFTMFNKAVLAPDGKTAIIANRGQNNVLYSENVFLFDATTGAHLKTGTTGPGPQWTGITPDGKNWIVLNMFSLTVIPTDNFDGLVEHQAPAGESLGSANVVFTSDSRFAYYAAAGTSGILRDIILELDLTTGSYLEKLQVGDSPDTLLDQPGSMAITSDGKTVVALEFVSGNIDLMTPITLRAGSKFVSSPDTFTGLSLINLSSQTNKITVYAMQDFGELNQETGVTNPVVFDLEPNQQISRTVAELFNFDDSNAPNGERTGWLAIYSEQPEVTGYVTIGKKDLTSLNGLSLDFNGDRLHDWILPVLERNGDAQVQLSTLNTTHYSTDYDVSRVGHDGKIIDSVTGKAASAGSRVQEETPDLFARDNLDLEGYFWMTSLGGVFSNELFNNGKSVELIKGINRKNYVGVTKLYAPQWATVTGWKTTLNLINGNLAEADVTITFHGGDDTILWRAEKHFGIGEQLRSELTALFTQPPSGFYVTVSDPSFLNAAGWLEVESSQDQILGLLSFTATDDHFAASYELTGTPLTQFVFPLASQNDFYQTGLALLNPNSDTANVTLEIWGMDGNIIASAPLTLGPQSRTAAYLNSLFPGMDPLFMGNLRVRSDKSLCGFALINDPTYSMVLAMTPVAMF